MGGPFPRAQVGARATLLVGEREGRGEKEALKAGTDGEETSAILVEPAMVFFGEGGFLNLPNLGPLVITDDGTKWYERGVEDERVGSMELGVLHVYSLKRLGR